MTWLDLDYDNFSNRRNMEPLDDSLDSNKTKSSIYNACKQLKQDCNVIRLRGGGQDPNNDSKYNEIPYLTSHRFIWDGLPKIDFVEHILNPLENGLGSMAIKGGTLLETVKRTDPGGLLGTPSRALAPVAVVEESKARNNKAFSCILNYIDTKSEFYIFCMRRLQTDGIAVYEYLIQFGNIPTPVRIIRAREDAWNRMTMDILKISYSLDGYFQWNQAVLSHGRKLGKNGNSMKDKFIDGLPTFFQSEKAQMRHDTRFVYPATLGLIPGLGGALPLAGIAHPNANEPDIKSLAMGYVGDWVTQISKVSQNTPYGLARSVTESDNSDEIINLMVGDVTPKTKCFVCGGEGHAASQILPDGTKVLCTNKVIQSSSNIDSKSISRMEKYKQQRDSYAKEVQNLNEQLEEANITLSKSKCNKNNYSRKQAIPQAHSTEEDSGEEDVQQAHSDLEQTDDGSDTSASSTIRSFAEVAHTSKRFGKFKRK